MDQTFSGEGLISNVAGINVKIFKIDKIKISVKTPSRARTLQSDFGNDLEVFKFLNENLEEKTERFVFQEEDFTLLVLASELEYFNGHLFIDGTFKGKNFFNFQISNFYYRVI